MLPRLNQMASSIVSANRHHAGLIADTKPYIVSKLSWVFLSSQELISTFEVRLYVHGAGFISHSLTQFMVESSFKDLVSQGMTNLQNDTGMPSLRWALSSKSMLRRGQLLHEAVDDCIGSEEYPRLESASFVVMPIQTLEARGPFYFPYIYVSPKPVLWVTKPNTLQPQLSKFSFPKLHPSSTPKCVSPNLFFWHSVQSLVFQLHQPATE